MVEKVIYIVLGILFEIISAYCWWCFFQNNWNFIALFFAGLIMSLGFFFFFRAQEIHKGNTGKK